ncbi:MAG: MFS transporter [Coriobacteriia bacterium]|nr:MFS transporter [Coriobacteriia bacterium]
MQSNVFAPLRIADFRRLWLGQVVSVVGDKIHTIAMAMMVYALTGSMLQMGVMLGVTLLPAAIFGLPAGVYIDRWDRRTTMMAADLVRAVIVLAIPWVVGYGIWWAYGLAFLASTVSLFFVPAKRALIPDIVGTDDLMAANSLDNASEAIAELAGLGLGAVIVASIGYRWAFSIDAATFVVSAISISLIQYRQKPLPFPAQETDFISETLGGVRAIWASEVLRPLSGVYVTSAMFASASIAVCYALALERYDMGAPGLAMLDGASAVGMLAGAMIVGRLGPGRAGAKFLAGMTMFGFVFSLVALADSIWAAMALLVTAGIANMFFFIPAITLFQTRSDASVRGRVMAANTTATRISMVLGIVLAGAVADGIRIETLIVIIGFAAILAAGIGWLSRPLREA